MKRRITLMLAALVAIAGVSVVQGSSTADTGVSRAGRDGGAWCC